jgi:hypothetical protein
LSVYGGGITKHSTKEIPDVKICMLSLIKVRILAEQVVREIPTTAWSYEMGQGTPSTSYQLWKLGCIMRQRRRRQVEIFSRALTKV